MAQIGRRKPKVRPRHEQGGVLFDDRTTTDTPVPAQRFERYRLAYPSGTAGQRLLR